MITQIREKFKPEKTFKLEKKGVKCYVVMGVYVLRAGFKRICGKSRPQRGGIGWLLQG
ncbi:MAG: hypothetical protein J5842_07525 [Lachnospiraceae bacterium]|nr:hypothetical protein [Lachnospiraceae bacterium]